MKSFNGNVLWINEKVGQLYIKCNSIEEMAAVREWCESLGVTRDTRDSSVKDQWLERIAGINGARAQRRFGGEYIIADCCTLYRDIERTVREKKHRFLFHDPDGHTWDSQILEFNDALSEHETPMYVAQGDVHPRMRKDVKSYHTESFNTKHAGDEDC